MIKFKIFELEKPCTVKLGVKDLYGPNVEKPGSFARNCLLARRMAEKGVRFLQLFHRGWEVRNRVRVR